MRFSTEQTPNNENGFEIEKSFQTKRTISHKSNKDERKDQRNKISSKYKSNQIPVVQVPQKKMNIEQNQKISRTTDPIVGMKISKNLDNI